jgi:hypothetical protein
MHFVDDTPQNRVKYGPLAGQYVDGVVWGNVTDLVDGFRELEQRLPLLKALASVNRQVALAKVGLNPKNLLGNILGNAGAHDIGGFPMWEQPLWIGKAARELQGNRAALREAITQGGGIGRSAFREAGIHSNLVAEVADWLGTQNLKSGLGRSTAFAAELYQKLRDVGAKTYEANALVDDVLKLAHYMYKREVHKYDPRRAAAEARSSGMDTSETPRWVRGASRYTHPFASWAHHFSLHAWDSAASRPLATFKWAILFPMLDASFSVATGQQDAGEAFSWEGTKKRMGNRAKVPRCQMIVVQIG